MKRDLKSRYNKLGSSSKKYSGPDFILPVSRGVKLGFYDKLYFCSLNLSEYEKSILSHWGHSFGFPESKKFEKESLLLLSSKNPNEAKEDGTQILFPDIFDVPFPSPTKPKFTFIDLFAGIGGFRIALQRLGGRCVFSSEWNTSAKNTYFSNYGEMPFGDITKPSTKNWIPNSFDVLCAGFPCQPFSISGRMKGFNDTRGTLFFDVCEIIQKHRPSVVFLENVKHLVHHDNGNTLSVIIEHLKRLGYTTSWRLLNASDFGVPQNRERIIIVATKNAPFNFDLIEKKARVSLNQILDSENNFEYLSPSSYTLIDNPKCQDSGLIFVGYRNKAIRKAGVRPGTENLSRVHKQPNRIYSAKGIHPTLPSQEVSGRYFILTKDMKVRKLTIGECYRLMGFPEEFLLSPSISDCYKQIGNSVCIPMIEAVGRQIVKNHLKIGIR